MKLPVSDVIQALRDAPKPLNIGTLGFLAVFTLFLGIPAALSLISYLSRGEFSQTYARVLEVSPQDFHLRSPASRGVFCSLKYVYWVDGKEYTGNKIGFESEYVGRIPPACSKFEESGIPKVGSKIQIFFEKKTPERAYYSIDYPIHTIWLYLSFVLAFLALHVVLALLTQKMSA